jgi:hypothetical protein
MLNSDLNIPAISLDMFPSEITSVSKHLKESDESHRLKTQLSRGAETFVIDYENCASEFNQAFFVRNYVKCLLYLRTLPCNILASVNTVVDLGGGAGPFSLAARHLNSQLATLVIDRSESQISQAIKLSVVYGLKHVSRTMLADMRQLRIDPRPMRILSYLVCENIDELPYNPALRSTLFGNRCIVVDYPHIVKKAALLASDFGGLSRHMVSAKHSVCPRLAEILGQPTITYGGVCIDFGNQQ